MTGVQTCALPICAVHRRGPALDRRAPVDGRADDSTDDRPRHESSDDCGARHHDAVHAPANDRRSRYAAAADGCGDHCRVRADLDCNQCGHDNDYSRVVVCLQNNDDVDAANRG